MAATEELEKELTAAYEELEQAKQRLAALRRRVQPEPVQDYELRGPDGNVKLSTLFGDKDDLILIHNMGTDCPYCTLWADGFNGVLHHLQDCAAFVVVSPDEPEVQEAFRASRGWRFAMYSAAGSTFIEDMGFGSDQAYFNSHAMPGVSAFHRNADCSIERVARDYFGPGDAYCGVWPLFDLLRDGPGEWAPQFEY
jgi:predicted dithiol-disulfide oxidoreductase (DUF899 family)